MEEKRNYLFVSFNDKDEAKKLGCRWDPDFKKWWYSDKNKNAKQIESKWKIFNPSEPSKPPPPAKKKPIVHHVVNYDSDGFDEVLGESDGDNVPMTKLLMKTKKK